jgi:hypothetical protein
MTSVIAAALSGAVAVVFGAIGTMTANAFDPESPEDLVVIAVITLIAVGAASLGVWLWTERPL